MLIKFARAVSTGSNAALDHLQKPGSKAFRKSVLLLACTTLILGCAAKDVKEENRNTDGTYDGSWVGTISRTPSQVFIEKWRITCWDMAGNMRMTIKDGKVRAFWRQFNHTAYIGDDGSFRVFMPYKDKLKNNSSNVESLSHGLNYIIVGSLAGNKMSGRLTLGYEDFANQGCSSKVNFAKQ